MNHRDWTLQRTVMCSEHGNREKIWRWPLHCWTVNLLTTECKLDCGKLLTLAYVTVKEPVAVVGQQLREDNMDGRSLA